MKTTDAPSASRRYYEKNKLGPRAVMPDHLVVYLRRFGQGWHVGSGLEELKAELAALGLEIKDE